ncbi:innexin [Schistosoma japonicum]|nr:innexin [Schistosoma japonicum]
MDYITINRKTMVAQEFINFFSSIQIPASIGIEDFSDRLNFFTTILFLIATLIVTAKQYVLGAMSCYVSVSPSGTGFETFLVNYCWVHGTIPLRSNEPLPETDDQWKDYDIHRRITCIVVSAKQYFLNSISCYIPVKPTGENYNSYLTDYCWVHGTIPLRPDEPMPTTPKEWEQYDQLRRINDDDDDDDDDLINCLYAKMS